MKRVVTTIRKSGHIVMAFALVLSILQPLPVHASGEAFTGGSAVSTTVGAQASVTDLQVSGTGNDTISVRLFVTDGSLAMTTTTGLTFTGSSSGNALQFSGTRTAINTALATLKYTAGSTPGTDTIEASLVQPGEIYYPGNGHLYEVVTATLTADAARTAAAARTKYGASGYLATITSAEENDYIASRLNDAGWMGASDVSVEGDWKWVTGPENGTSFWLGTGSGSAVSGRYENWASGEPNNSGGGAGEDCAQFLAGSTGEWNDLPCSSTTLPRYVVEYGTTGTLPAVQSKDVAVTIGTSTHSINSCAQLQDIANTPNSQYDTFELTQDIDCAGTDFDPIGPSGTDWNIFKGVFDGNGHKISNLNIEASTAYAALFEEAEQATFRDLTLESGEVVGNGGSAQGTAALVGHARLGITLTNITSHINVTGDALVAGLVALAELEGVDSTVTNVHADGTVAGPNTGSEAAGGLFGHIDAINGAELTVVRSAFTGSVTGGVGVGGLVGMFYMQEDGDTGMTIRDSYASGSVSGKTYVGGLVGSVDPNVNTSNSAGTSYTTFTRTYAVNSIAATNDYMGGFVGYHSGVNIAGENFTVTDSFVGTPFSGGTPHIASLFYVNRSGANNGTLTTEDVYVDDLRSGLASWTNTAVTDVFNVNTAGNQTTYFFNTTTQEPLDEWDFSSGNVWFRHPNTYPTHAPGNDDDGDGFSTDAENAGLNGGDGNNDGTLDSLQANVVSLVSGFTGKTVVIELSDQCTFTQVAMRQESQFAVQDGGYNYPQGLAKFTANCGTPGFTTSVKLFFYDVAHESMVLRKHNSVRNAWYSMPNSGVSQLNIAGSTVTRASYEVTDGGLLDEDATANGIIVDPAGLAAAAVGVPNTGFGGATRK